MTSTLLLYLAASLAIGLIGLMVYDWLPHTPRQHSKAIRAMQSPVTLLIYLVVIAAAVARVFEEFAVYS